MRRSHLLLGGLTALLLAIQPSCSPTPASAEVTDPVLNVVAAGDTAHAIYGATIRSGTADSVAAVFSLRGAPPKRVTVAVPITGQRQVFTADLVPSPAYAEGDTGTVTACPTAYRKGVAYAGACSSKLYTRPVVPPVVTGDSIVVSMRIVPDTTTALLGDTVGFMVFTTYQSGRQTVALGNYWTNQEPGIQTVSATLQGHTVLAKIRVLVSPREPPNFLPFATADLSEMPSFPRAPLKAMPCPGAVWCGKWL